MGYKPYFMEIKLWREFHFYNIPKKDPNAALLYMMTLSCCYDIFPKKGAGAF